ncbi:hypothetical protein VTK73DRAFT_9948 [Phialemonium thermophilum]|uniref:Aminoglycoside phosphotransferase domain-containing protein n=1 Tax=Phialemonium thermophilum TaxID=223376 RepID=A0ABR3XIA5_9PEZI
MASEHQSYYVDEEISNFFKRASATRATCDDRAKELVSGLVIPVVVQGVCSHSVNAGTRADFVVQSRPKGFQLNLQKLHLTRENHRSLVPQVLCIGLESPAKGRHAYHEDLHRKAETELRLLLVSLPDRFHPIIQKPLDSIPSVFSLPVVLLHQDFDTCNIMVEGVICRLV